MDWTQALIAALLFALLVVWTAWERQRALAWKWRKRWIEQRFGIEVFGTRGDYFCVMERSSGKNCILFYASPKAFHEGAFVRHWNQHLNMSELFPDDWDMPSERELFLGTPLLKNLTQIGITH